MGRQFKTWVYTADDGRKYNRKAPGDYTAQGGDGGKAMIGGSLATVVNPQMPSSMRPRVALCQDDTGHKYRIVCYENTSQLFMNNGQTFTIFDRDGGAAITVKQYGSEGERARHKVLTP